VAYPIPDAIAIGEWQTALDALATHLDDASIALLAIHDRTLTVLASSPLSARNPPGAEIPRTGRHVAESLIDDYTSIAVADLTADARWDATEEHRQAVGAYLGTRISWPDEEPFAVLEACCIRPLEEDRAAALLALLDTIANTLRLRLELLQRRARDDESGRRDPLTGMAGPGLFDELLAHNIEVSRRGGTQLWLLTWEVADRDRLEKHLAPTDQDRLIRAIAERAQTCTRRSDVLGRLDRWRFALLLLDANEFVATAVSDRLQRSARRVPPLTDTPSEGVGLLLGMTPFNGEESIKQWHGRLRRALRGARRSRDQRKVLLPT